MLSGDLSDTGDATTPADHPRSLFTLLGRSHEYHVSEPYTDLCPPSLCPESGEGFFKRCEHALKDMVKTSFRLLLPDAAADRLPKPAPVGFVPPKKQLTDFISSVRDSDRPPLYFVHAQLPHFPYIYLPSGRRYPSAVDGTTALAVRFPDRWRDDEWQVIQQRQRMLLQVAYVDRLLGRLIDRLRKEGLYDPAAIIVISDHGASFRPGELRRDATAENVHEVMLMPFLLKAPGQRRGAVRDDPVQTIDVMPTLAAALGTRLPWRTDGHNALTAPVRRERVTTINQSGTRVSIGVEELLKRRRAVVREQVRRFGQGDLRRIFAAGPHRELLGRRAPTEPSGDAEYRFEEGARELRSYDPAAASETFPARVVGRLLERRATGRTPLAVALNGRVRATTWTYEADGKTKFSAMLPPDAVRRGRNEVAVLAIEPGGRLRRLTR